MTINDLTPKAATLHYLNLALNSGLRGRSRQAIQNAIDSINEVKKEISDLHCRRLRYGDKPILDTHTKGLRLQPKKKGMLWTFRFDFKGKQPVLELGEYPEVSLSVAREKAHEARTLINRGINPKNTVTHELTMDEMCRKYLTLAEKYKDTWKRDQQCIETDILPFLKGRSAISITAEDAGQIIDRVVARGALSQAEGVLKVGRFMFNVALGRGKGRRYLAVGSSKVEPWIEMANNPFSQIIIPEPEEEAIPCVLQDRLLVNYLTQLKTSGINHDIINVLTLQLLTVTRISEATHATWEEIDLEAGVWTLPRSRTKNKTEHRVFLSDQAITLLKSLNTSEGPVFAFKDRKRDYIRDFIATQIRKYRKALGVPDDFVSHSLRHTSLTLLASLGASDNIRSRISNHKKSKNDMEARYNAHSYDIEAKEWWQKLADELDCLRESQ